MFQLHRLYKDRDVTCVLGDVMSWWQHDLLSRIGCVGLLALLIIFYILIQNRGRATRNYVRKPLVPKLSNKVGINVGRH